MNYILWMTGLFVICLSEYIVPRRFRVYLLLLASAVFFICVSPAAFGFWLVVTVLSWLAGKRLERGRSRVLLGTVAAVIVLLLAGIKYSGVWRGTSIAIPLGFSYYSLMVTGYMVDVYRGAVRAERNLVRYALFTGFFAQVVAGPVGRNKELRRQYERGPEFDLTGIRTGFLMLLTGLFQKMVLADNILLLVTGVCEGEFEGIAVVFAMLLYSLVIYFDFGGYSLIAVGGAKMLGVDLMENFNAPYRACSVQEFWRRWHISLSSWFRDYVYIPMGGSRKGSWRRDVNTLIVFVLSGAWHGAAAGYMLWGGIHGLYQVVGKHTKEFRERLFAKARQKASFVWLQRGTVYLLVSFAWVPFFAGKLWKTRDLWGRMFAFCPWALTDGSLLELGVGWPVIVVCLLGTMFVFAIDRYRQKADFYRIIAEEHAWVRFGLYAVLFTAILLAGAYGAGYRETDFIYGQF